MTRGWVLGPTDDVPASLLPVMRLISPAPAFDEELLRLARWISERYVVPLATVIGRLVPPRVAAVDEEVLPSPGARPRAAPRPAVALPGYRGGETLLAALRDPGPDQTGFLVRIAPGEESTIALEVVSETLSAGRQAILVVPEASPMPATAAAVLDALGPRACDFVGGDRRLRYRRWREIAAGHHDVVVGTRPAVFAPMRNLGAIVVMREGHAALREDRAPYTHVRDVAIARARLRGFPAVLTGVCPSVEAASMGLRAVEPLGRRWPPVEVIRPAAQGRAPRLVAAIRAARRGFVYEPLPGAGVAERCRSCGAPAACARCGGVLRMQDDRVACVVCEVDGVCGSCGASSFGVRPGGAERVEAWARRAAGVPVRRVSRPRLPRDHEILVGGPEVVRDLGPAHLDLVAILDADLAERRPGLAARQRALTTWAEAVAWAWPNGRAIVQTARPGDPAIQALVRGHPARFHDDERERRAHAGFPVGAAVFRVAGRPGLEHTLAELRPLTLLASERGELTVCLLAIDERDVPAFGREVRARAARGDVTRVEAEPHLER